MEAAPHRTMAAASRQPDLCRNRHPMFWTPHIQHLEVHEEATDPTMRHWASMVPVQPTNGIRRAPAPSSPWPKVKPIQWMTTNGIPAHRLELTALQQTVEWNHSAQSIQSMRNQKTHGVVVTGMVCPSDSIIHNGNPSPSCTMPEARPSVSIAAAPVGPTTHLRDNPSPVPRHSPQVGWFGTPHQVSNASVRCRHSMNPTPSVILQAPISFTQSNSGDATQGS